MDINPFKIKEFRMASSSNKSKVKFRGNFTKELQITVDAIEEAIEEELGKHFKVGSILSGNNNIKIRIKDDEQKINRIVNCVFRYDNNDEKFGNTNIELASSELSKKPNLHYVGKFNVMEREKIIEKVLYDLIEGINEIY